MSTNTTPRVYVRCLAAYTNGHLHGQWVDAVDEDEIREGIAQVLASSPVRGDEWAFHDYEGFGELASSLGENPSPEALAAIGKAIEEEGERFIGYADNEGSLPDSAAEVEELVERMRDTYLGDYDDAGALAYEWAVDRGTVALLDSNPLLKGLQVDWDGMGRDLLLGGEVIEIDGSYYTA